MSRSTSKDTTVDPKDIPTLLLHDSLQYLDVVLDFEDYLMQGSRLRYCALIHNAIEKELNSKHWCYMVDQDEGEEIEFDPAAGLCDNGLDQVVKAYSKAWPLWSGSEMYPVPHPKYLPGSGEDSDIKIAARWHYSGTSTKSMYTGEYGKLRFHLIGFIRSKIEEEL